MEDGRRLTVVIMIAKMAEDIAMAEAPTARNQRARPVPVTIIPIAQQPEQPGQPRYSGVNAAMAVTSTGMVTGKLANNGPQHLRKQNAPPVSRQGFLLLPENCLELDTGTNTVTPWIEREDIREQTG